MAKIPASVKARVGQLITGGALERETVKKTKLDNPARRIQWEVGDAKQDDFYPQFKTIHWDEANFSARLVAGQGAVTEHEGKLAYDDGEQIARFYEKDTGDEDGGFEFDVVLPKKPKGNTLTWTLQHKGLDFFYQPELTQEEVEQGASRPDNVVGSYAVYHKTGRNNKVGGKEYRTGKAFHIYRPYFEDANGDWVWGELNIDTKKDEMTVTAPRGWLAKAVYPVVLDPTFGYTTIGASSFNILTNTTSTRRGSAFSLSEGGTLDSIHAALKTFFGSETTADFATAINSKDSAGSGSHGEVANIERTDLTITSTETFYTFTGGGESLSVDDYVLSAIGDYNDFDSYNNALSYDTASVPDYDESSSTSYPSLRDEDPWTVADGNNDRKYSIYATYTASSSSETATMSPGSYTLTGQSVTATIHRSATLTPGSYTLTGQTVAASISRLATMQPGSYTLTGENVEATLNPAVEECAVLDEGGGEILAENGTVIGDESCGAGTSETATLTPGVYTLTGGSLNVTIHRTATMQPGSYSLTGQPVQATRSLVATLSPGAYTLNGQTVTVTRSLRATLTPGSYTLTGQSINVTKSLVAVLTPGVYTLVGEQLRVSSGEAIVLKSGSYTLTGGTVEVTKHLRRTLEPGSYTLTGQPLTATRSLQATLSLGIYTLTGGTVDASITRLAVLSPGEYVLTGQTVTVTAEYLATLTPGEYVLTGGTVTATLDDGTCQPVYTALSNPYSAKTSPYGKYCA